MLKPQKMTRLVIAGHKDRMADVIGALHDQGVMHLEDYLDPTQSTGIGSPLPEGDEVSELLVRTRGVQKSLGVEEARHREMVTDDPGGILKDAEEAVLPVLDRLNDARARLSQTASEIAVLEPFASVDVDLSTVEGLEHVKVFMGRVNQDPRPALAAAGLDHELDVARDGKAFSVALAVRRSDAQDAESLLATMGFSPAAVPSGEGTPATRLQTLRERSVTLRHEVQAIEEEMDALRDAWAVRLASLEHHLADEVQKTQAPLRFAVTAATFHAEGWVPLRAVAGLESSLADHFGRNLWMEVLGDGSRGQDEGGDADAEHVSAHGAHAGPEHEPPTALRNKGIASPYQFLLSLLGRPRYWELDPTKLMLIFFPLFFGLMVGDVLVGVLIMLFGFYLKSNHIFGIGGNAVGRLLVVGGLVSVVVGLFIFGEALGIHFVVDEHGLEEGERSWEEIIYGKEAVLAGHGFPHEGFIHKTGGEDLAHASGTGGGELHAAASHSVPPSPNVPPPPGDSAVGDGAHGDDHDDGHGGLLSPHSDTHLSVNGWVNLGYYSKVHDVQALLIWSIIIGIVHIVLGLLLGVRNIYVHHGLKLAVQEKVSWLLILASIGVMGWAVVSDAAASVLYGGVAVFVVATALLWMGVQHTLGVGFISILEIPSLIGNILSYTRLAAIGASKAGIAIAFSAIGFGMVGGVGGWIIYLIGALLITVLAILAGSLQSLRLQFVEFFSKFYEGGGRPYVPFGRRAA